MPISTHRERSSSLWSRRRILPAGIVPGVKALLDGGDFCVA
jgi:hypothetical protein